MVTVHDRIEVCVLSKDALPNS
eukprot:COSAG02_NODE_51127_length_316_cov_0.709677_1_plen_21_part_10